MTLLERPTDRNSWQTWHMLLSVSPRGKLIVSVILNNVNSSFASLDFACLELLLLISTSFLYTFTIYGEDVS